jgi:streptomycin 6-kinase
MSAPVEIPERVRRKAKALGTAGERWLRDIAGIVSDLELTWQLNVGPAIAGGTGAFVAVVGTANGTDAILKVSIPEGLEGHSPFAEELHTLQLADGHGYVKVLRADTDLRAMLQEHLGRPLRNLGLPVEAQIDIIAATLRDAWRRVPPDPVLRTGAAQARSLRESIRVDWEHLGHPCAELTLERAEQCALARESSFDASTAVLIHGDAHPANVLEDPSAPGRFKLIDPDGMISEPAHDLAIPLRDWTDELLREPDPVAVGLRWCAQLGRADGIDTEAIWEWAFLERVSTGLFLLRLGESQGQEFLDIADRWNDVSP